MPMKILTTLFLAALLTACGNSSAPVPATEPAVPVAPVAPVEIKTLSNRADLISGGSVLVEILMPAEASIESLRVTVAGNDVSTAFARRADGRVLGLVTGIPEGSHLLRAQLEDAGGAEIMLTNHPIGGPVFAGPQVQPWPCATEANGLGIAQDAQCNAPSVVSYKYVSAATGQFSNYDPANPPPDVATTTTLEGKTVPYIVRFERGTMDRGIYDVAVLADPAESPSFSNSPAAWNGRLVILFGGGTAPKHGQTKPDVNVQNHHALSLGFMVAGNGLHVHGNNANDNVSAEALMMLKEHIVENYGSIRHTIGEGCSGGGLQQYMIASMYPGLLDGIIPTCSYADVWTTAMDVMDCSLLLDYYNNKSPALWAGIPQRMLVDGHGNHSVCIAWEATFAARFDPGSAAGCGLPPDQVYNAQSNPSGTRCTLQDYQKAIWGPRPQDGFAKRPLDNVGVQYGLSALEDGLILPEQFVDLNEKLGGKDIDGQLIGQRMVADEGSLAIAYDSSQVTDASQLATVPIIDLRGQDNEEIHTSYNSYVVRARLDRDNGQHGNQIIFTGPIPLLGSPAFQCATGSFTDVLDDTACTHSPLLLMDRWLNAVATDTSADPLAAKILRNKPSDAVDTCFIGEQAVTDPVVCAAVYPVFGSPRLVAGMPLTHDAIKCRLKPLNRADYTATFTDAQWARLQAAFPEGVCDWSQPGVDQQPSTPWLTFMDGPGGKPLGEAPRSKHSGQKRKSAAPISEK